MHRPRPPPPSYTASKRQPEPTASEDAAADPCLSLPQKVEPHRALLPGTAPQPRQLGTLTNSWSLPVSAMVGAAAAGPGRAREPSLTFSERPALRSPGPPSGVTSAGTGCQAPAGRARGCSDRTTAPRGPGGGKGGRVMEAEAVDWAGAAPGQGQPRREPHRPPSSGRPEGQGAGELGRAWPQPPFPRLPTRAPQEWEAIWKGCPLPTCELSPGRAHPTPLPPLCGRGVFLPVLNL